MGYGSTPKSKSIVSTLEKVVPWCIVVCSSQWIYGGGGTSCGSNHGICGRWKEFFDRNIHENMTSKHDLWAFVNMIWI